MVGGGFRCDFWCQVIPTELKLTSLLGRTTSITIDSIFCKVAFNQLVESPKNHIKQRFPSPKTGFFGKGFDGFGGPRQFLPEKKQKH